MNVCMKVWVFLCFRGVNFWPFSAFDVKYGRRRESHHYLRHVCGSVRPSVRPSVRMEQLGSHWTDVHEIFYLNTCRKSVHTIKILLKSAKKKE